VSPISAKGGKPTLAQIGKIGAKVVSHGRYVAFQMAEVAIARNLFGNILRLIAELRPPPDPVRAHVTGFRCWSITAARQSQPE
jgi:hypothetical protein